MLSASSTLPPVCNPVTSPRLHPLGGRRRSSHLLKISNYKRRNNPPMIFFCVSWRNACACVSFVRCFICQFSVTMMRLLNGHIPSLQSIADAQLPQPKGTTSWNSWNEMKPAHACTFSCVDWDLSSQGGCTRLHKLGAWMATSQNTLTVTNTISH